MLVLTRKTGQNIVVGGRIRISVIDVRGRQVRLGVEAPPDMPIHREEVFLKIQEENLQAASARPDDLSLALRFMAGEVGEEQE